MTREEAQQELLTERTGGGSWRSGGACWGARSGNVLQEEAAVVSAYRSLAHGPSLAAAAARRGRRRGGKRNRWGRN